MYGENGYLTEVLDYDGPVVYRDGGPDYIRIGKGRLVFLEEKEPVYEYFLADHLGNTRVTFRVEGDSVSVVQENHYYPFGLSMAGLDYSGLPEEDATQNPYLYNGKEFQGDEGLGWYDYGTRFYDAQVGRWWSVDPEVERYYSWSNYNYVFSNPILIVDPDGSCPTCNDDDYSVGATTSSGYGDKRTDWLYLGDRNWQDITGWYSGNIDGTTIYSPTNLWNDEGNVMTKEIAGNSYMFSYFMNADWVSDNFRQDLMTASIHHKQEEFINHPVTQITIGGLIFVATGGIEGLISLTSAGIQGSKLLRQQSTRLLNFADDVALKAYVRTNLRANYYKRNIISKLLKRVWNNSSMSTKKWLIRNNVTSKIKNIYNTNYEFVGPQAFDNIYKMYENFTNTIRIFK